MFCKRCKAEMKRVVRVDNCKSYILYKCPLCYYESKPIPYYFDDYKSDSKTTKRDKRKKKR